MIYTCKNAYYYKEIAPLGGIETHLYYMAKKYPDLTILYSYCNPKQYERLSLATRPIHLYDGDTIICDHLFLNAGLSMSVFDFCNIKAKEISCVLHGDYLYMVNANMLSRSRLPLDVRIDNYYGVSQLVCDQWKKLSGIDAINMYQPVVPDKKSKPISFVCASRIGSEKGLEKIKWFTYRLDHLGINYLIYIYTGLPNHSTLRERTINDITNNLSNNIIILNARLDFTDKIQAYDCLIQFSNNEGYCLSVAEALALGIPCITYDLPVFRELYGRNNDYILRVREDFSDLTKEKLDNLLAHKSTTYYPPEDHWGEVFNKTYENKPYKEIKANVEWRNNNMSVYSEDYYTLLPAYQLKILFQIKDRHKKDPGFDRVLEQYREYVLNTPRKDRTPIDIWFEEHLKANRQPIMMKGELAYSSQKQPQQPQNMAKKGNNNDKFKGNNKNYSNKSNNFSKKANNG